LEHSATLAIVYLPQSDIAVFATAGQQLSLGAEGYSPNPIVVALKGA